MKKLQKKVENLKESRNPRNAWYRWQHGYFTRSFVHKYHSPFGAYFQSRPVQNNLKSEINIEHTKLRKARENNQKSGSYNIVLKEKKKKKR